MKKLLVVALVAIPAVLPLAADNQDIPEGPIVNVGGEGRVAIVSAEDKDAALLAEVATNMGKILMIDIGVEKGVWSLASADAAFKAAKAQVAVFVVDDATLPISLVAPESKWGVVNRKNMNDRQLRKAVTRVALSLLGAANSRYEASAMYPAYSLADLDKGEDSVTVDTVMAVFQTLDKLGIKQYRQISYRDACIEGVAPKPTTELERKIAKSIEASGK